MKSQFSKRQRAPIPSRNKLVVVFLEGSEDGPVLLLLATLIDSKCPCRDPRVPAQWPEVSSAANHPVSQRESMEAGVFFFQYS